MYKKKSLTFLFSGLLLSWVCIAEDLNLEPEFIGNALSAVGDNKIYDDGQALSPQQLEACVTDGIQIDEHKIDLIEQREANEKSRRSLRQLEYKISSTRVDKQSSISVRKYNKLIADYGKAFEEIKRERSNWSRQVTLYNNSVKQLNRNCAGRDFYEEDLKQIKQRISQLPSIFNNRKTIR